MAERHPGMGDVRGIGLMIGVEFVKDKGTAIRRPICATVWRRLPSSMACC